MLSTQESADKLIAMVLPNCKDLESAKAVCIVICNKMDQENKFYFDKYNGAKYSSKYWPEVKEIIINKTKS